MRFLAPPWIGLIESGAWLRNAAHGNACARYFAGQIVSIPGVQISSVVEANAVFVTASDEVLNCLRQRGWKFYTFIGGAARFMFYWDKSHERIDELSRDLRQCAMNQADQS
jgi:threonine aldolase